MHYKIIRLKTAHLIVSFLCINLFTFNVSSESLKFGHPYNESHPLAQGAVMFADLVREGTNNEIDIKVFPNSTIGSSRDLIESMQISAVDIALVPTTNVATFYSPLDIFYLPFVFRSSEHAYQVADSKVGQKLYEDMRNKIGIRTLAMFESGFRTITTKDKKIVQPDDMKGVKFRVVNNPLNVATFKALGANPTPMALSEVFTALQQGTVDGQDNPVGNVKAFGFDKVQNFITLSKHQWAGIMLLISDKKWQSFSSDVQKTISNSALQAQNWERQEINNIEAQYLAEMEEAGMTVTRLTAEQTNAFQEAMKVVWDENRERLTDELIDSVVNTK